MKIELIINEAIARHLWYRPESNQLDFTISQNMFLWLERFWEL